MGKRTGTTAISILLISMFITGTFLSVATDGAGALQEGDFYYTIGGNPMVAKVTSYQGAGGPVTIPALLGGFPTVTIGNNAFDTRGGHLITSIVIPGSVRTIGAYAFQSCTALKSITIPDGVTTIGSMAFVACNSLTSVTIGKNVTAIGQYAFQSYSPLTSINVSPENPSYASVDGVLYNKDVTNLIQYPCGRPGTFNVPWTVTIIGNHSFQYSRYLTLVTIPETVTVIGGFAFDSCNLMTSITFLGLVAPTTAETSWVYGSNPELRGHASSASDFPPVGSVWHGLKMGKAISGLPLAPTGLVGVSGNGQAALNWTAPASVQGTDYYMIFQDGVLLTDHPNGTNTTISGLLNGNNYSFAVAAHNLAGIGARSNVFTVRPFFALNAPTGLTASADSNKVMLNWISSEGPISGYSIYRGLSASLLSPIGMSIKEYFEDTSVTSGCIYSYKVSALNSDGESILTEAVSVHVPFAASVPVIGNVVDQNGVGLAGVTVALDNGVSVRTDASGSFLVMADQGNNTLTLSGIDIETRKFVIEIGSSGSDLGNIQATKTGSDLGQIVLVAGVIGGIMLLIGFLLVRLKNRKGAEGRSNIQIVLDMNKRH